MRSKTIVKITEDEIKDLLSNVRLSSKNHFVSDCPICGKNKHFYINRTTHKWDCKKCGESGNIVRLLSLMGKLYEFSEFKSIERGNIKSLFDNDTHEEIINSLEVPDKKMPIGFKRFSTNDYLVGRKFIDRNFKEHVIGTTNLVPSLKNHIIFGIFEDKKCKGYLARYIGKENRAKYNNCKGVNFSHLLFGFDEITERTQTVIVLEGLIDKITLDNILHLWENEEVKCVCTFGKKISKFQVLKLQSKGVKNLILIYDEDAITEMKRFSVELHKYFDVKITFTFNMDINDSKESDVLEIFDRLKSPEDFARKTVKLL